MARLQLPHPPVLPDVSLTELLAPYETGQILDSGSARSAWSTGAIVATTLGVAVCDTESGEVVGVPWADVTATASRGGELTVVVPLPDGRPLALDGDGIGCE